MIRDGLLLYGRDDRGTELELEQAWLSYEERARARGGFPARPGALELDEIDETVHPIVSDNRWVTTCPRCNGGVGLRVGYSRGCCFDCGGILTAVEWPIAKILGPGVDALERRPKESRHWNPMVETPQDLRFENIAHGFPIGGA